MKLIDQLKTFAALTRSTLTGWKIETTFGYKRFYEIFLTPSLRYNDWSAIKMREGATGDFEKYAERTEYRITLAFLTAHASVALTKETPI